MWLEGPHAQSQAVQGHLGPPCGPTKALRPAPGLIFEIGKQISKNTAKLSPKGTTLTRAASIIAADWGCSFKGVHGPSHAPSDGPSVFNDINTFPSPNFQEFSVIRSQLGKVFPNP
ncbi:hypothetical protein ACU8KH_04521 [Lachancea thermotolerans]